MKLDKILVATSGNGADEEAVKLACNLAKKSKAEVYVVYVIEVKRSLPLVAVVESEVDKAESVLTHAEDVAADNDYEVETDLIQARDAGSAIVDEARERKVNLILMGMSHKMRFGMFDLGSAVPRVLEEAPCPVLVYREYKIEGKL